MSPWELIWFLKRQLELARVAIRERKAGVKQRFGSLRALPTHHANWRRTQMKRKFQALRFSSNPARMAITYVLIFCVAMLVSTADGQASSGAVASGDALLRSGKEALQQYSLGIQLDRESLRAYPVSDVRGLTSSLSLPFLRE